MNIFKFTSGMLDFYNLQGKMELNPGPNKVLWAQTIKCRPMKVTLERQHQSKQNFVS